MFPNTFSAFRNDTSGTNLEKTPPNFVYLYSANYTDCYYVNPLSTNALPLSIFWH